MRRSATHDAAHRAPVPDGLGFYLIGQNPSPPRATIRSRSQTKMQTTLRHHSRTLLLCEQHHLSDSTLAAFLLLQQQTRYADIHLRGTRRRSLAPSIWAMHPRIADHEGPPDPPQLPRFVQQRRGSLGEQFYIVRYVRMRYLMKTDRAVADFGTRS
jgi:hypothetical protein